MGRVARLVLAKFSGIFWAATVILCVIRLIDTDLNPISAPIVVLAAAAACGTVCAQIQDKRDAELAQLARDLADATRQPGRVRPPLRQAQ